MATEIKKWTFNGYHAVLDKNLTIESLRRLCYDGLLRKSVLRSLVWRILLNCLPVCKLEWKSILERTRTEYINLKRTHITDPHDQSFPQDPQQNNPLTQTEQNPWKKYFEDHDLRDIIAKDVHRTFPEIPFFQQDCIRQSMSQILIVYAKQHPYISYKQGMHEILAPLLFVLCSDIELFGHVKEGSEFETLPEFDREILQYVYDRQFLEHDVYMLFREVMLEVGGWYEDTDITIEKSVPNEPFMRLQDITPTTPMSLELASVGDLLYSIDPELSSYLKGLDIPPQLYGIRWLRLLFGREFPIHDLLFLWDVIFCERPIARMVQSTFIGMLIYIRELLLRSDYGGCLHYLMKYPPVVDISVFVQLARHLYSPKKVAKPALPSQTNFANITVAGVVHPNAYKDNIDFDKSSFQMRPRQRSMLDKVKGTFIESPVVQKTIPQQLTPKKGKVSGRSTPIDKAPNFWEKELLLMENQVACLQSTLNEKDILCSEVAQGIDKCASRLQEATNAETVRAIADDLKNLSSRLTCQFVSQDRIEMAHEVRAASSRPRGTRLDNEMIELKSNLMM